jgi:hypothetical protein
MVQNAWPWPELCLCQTADRLLVASCSGLSMRLRNGISRCGRHRWYTSVHRDSRHASDLEGRKSACSALAGFERHEKRRSDGTEDGQS